MFQGFPANHPFASYARAGPSSPISPSYELPTISGPVPPRRQRIQRSHIRSDSSTSSISSSSSSSNTSFLLTTPKQSRCGTPTSTQIADIISNVDEYLSTLPITPKQSQSTLTPTNDFESFAAGLKGLRNQFGSTGRRGGMELSERHDRVAESLRTEIEGAELRSAVKATRAVNIGRLM